MNKEKALEKLALLVKQNYDDDSGGNTELNHINADDILCEFLIFLGHADIVKSYDKIEKWYA